MKNPAIEAAKLQWQEASKAHVNALTSVRTANEALDRLQGLIANEATELAKAKSEQRSGILAEFGLGGKAQKQLQSVADVQARIDAFESVLPEHEQALKQAQENAKRTDAAVKEAEGQILKAKADEAAQEEAKAFAAFKAAHLKYMATGAAAKRREQCIKLNPGYWTTRLYGDRHHIDYFVPTVPEMTQDLINQAEKGE